MEVPCRFLLIPSQPDLPGHLGCGVCDALEALQEVASGEVLSFSSCLFHLYRAFSGAMPGDRIHWMALSSRFMDIFHSVAAAADGPAVCDNARLPPPDSYRSTSGVYKVALSSSACWPSVCCRGGLLGRSRYPDAAHEGVSRGSLQ